MILELLQDTGYRNYKWFNKMFSLWSNVMFDKEVELSDKYIEEYFREIIRKSGYEVIFYKIIKS